MDLFLDYQAAEVATSLCGEPATVSDQVARDSLRFLISVCLQCLANKNEDTDFSHGPSSSKFLGREFQH